MREMSAPIAFCHYRRTYYEREVQFDMVFRELNHGETAIIEEGRISVDSNYFRDFLPLCFWRNVSSQNSNCLMELIWQSTANIYKTYRHGCYCL